MVVIIEANVKSKKNLVEFKSIKTKMMAIIVVMLIIGGTVLTGIAAIMAANALERSAIETLHAAGASSSEKLVFVNTLGRDLVTTISLDGDIRSLLVHWNEGVDVSDEQIAVSDSLIELADSISLGVTAISILDNNGIIVASSNPSIIGRDDSGLNFVKNQQRRAYVGVPFIETGDIPVIPYARPVYDDDRNQVGLVGLGLKFPDFDEEVFSTLDLSDRATSFLVGPDGTIFSGVDGDYSPFLSEKFDLSIFSAGQNMVQTPGYRGHMEYIVKTPVRGTNWLIITTERVEEVRSPIMFLIMMMVVSLIIVIVAGLFAADFIAHGFTRPILALKESADQLAVGDVDVSITHVGTDEIGQLADAFRHIVENTKQKAQYLDRLASGDLGDRTIYITATSDRDVEGKALIRIRKTLFYMVEQLDTLAHQAAEGDLNFRVDADSFEGVYRELFETLNHAFDLIITPLQEITRLSISYSSGDYSDRFDPDVAVKGDFVSLKAALNQIGVNSSDALCKIRHGVHDIGAGTFESSNSIEDIATSIATLAESSSHVSLLADQNDADIDQALAAMNDLSDTVSAVALRTASVSELASQSSELAYGGVKRAELAGKGMEEIMESAATVSKTISDMSNQIDAISEIVEIITKIAEQTGLIALNAAIEAAGVGEAGLGFAIVSDEVKALALEAQSSAEHIGSIIDNLQKMSAEMTTGMEKASKAVKSGSDSVNEAITIFHQMDEAISDVNKSMSEVAAVSEEQAASVQEITASMSKVRDMVQDTAREATNSASAAEEISASLNEIKAIAAQYAQLTKSIEEQVDMFKIE